MKAKQKAKKALRTFVASALLPLWGDPGQPFGVKVVQGPRRAHVPPSSPYPLAGVRDLPFPEISGLLLPDILLKDSPKQEVFCAAGLPSATRSCAGHPERSMHGFFFVPLGPKK